MPGESTRPGLRRERPPPRRAPSGLPAAGWARAGLAWRWLGTFLEDPLDVPSEVLEFVAAQIEVADPSKVKRYTERAKWR